MINYAQLLQGMQGGQQQPQTTPVTGYNLQNGTTVMPALATGRAATATGMTAAPTVSAGQFGGQGMAMPAGSTAIGGAGAGAGAAGIASGLISSLGSAATSYVQASTDRKALLPQYQATLADFPAATVGQKQQIYA